MPSELKRTTGVRCEDAGGAAAALAETVPTRPVASRTEAPAAEKRRVDKTVTGPTLIAAREPRQCMWHPVQHPFICSDPYGDMIRSGDARAEVYIGRVSDVL